jgi:hypothetical protein
MESKMRAPSRAGVEKKRKRKKKGGAWMPIGG